jgi:hypothetical protein
MSRITNLERLVQYQDELSDMVERGLQDTEDFKKLEKQVKDLEAIMPKYHAHVYENIRKQKNLGKKH